MRLTFPSPKNRTKATKRFEAIYPTLKTIALAGFQSKKRMKQVSEQLFSTAIHAAGKGNCNLTGNPACYEQWENLYLDNIDGSLFILQKVSTYQKEISVKLSTNSLRKTLEHFRKKNQTALSSKEYNLKHILLKEADKQCRVLLTLLFPGQLWLKVVMILSVLLGICSIMLTVLPLLSRSDPSV